MYNGVYYKTYVLPPVNEREALRYAGCKGGISERVMQTLAQCINESQTAFSPRVCYRVLPAQELLTRFPESGLLKLRLQNSKEALVFAATVGIEIDRLILRYEEISPAKALLFQGIGAERIETLCDLFCENMAAELSQQGYAAKPRFSAGYGDFSLEAQRWFSNVLDMQRKVGVTLSESLLMTPTKSVTAVVPLIPLEEK